MLAPLEIKLRAIPTLNPLYISPLFIASRNIHMTDLSSYLPDCLRVLTTSLGQTVIQARFAHIPAVMKGVTVTSYLANCHNLSTNMKRNQVLSRFCFSYLLFENIHVHHETTEQNAIPKHSCTKTLK